jgi:hypothetical protein
MRVDNNPAQLADPRRPAFELSLTGQPRSWQVQEHAYRCKGYGRARWGMTLAGIKALIALDFPEAVATLKQHLDPVTLAPRVEIQVPSLPQGPGRAHIVYLFGGPSLRLVGVSLHWVTDGDPSPEQRLPLVQAATKLAAQMLTYRWAGSSTMRGAVRGPGALLLFSGRDESGAEVSISLDGIAFDVERAGTPGRPEHRPAPQGPAALRLLFTAGPPPVF